MGKHAADYVVDLVIVSVICQPDKKFSMHDLVTTTPSDPQVGQQLLKLFRGLSWPRRRSSGSVCI